MVGMHWVRTLGGLTTLGGLVAYVVGSLAPYPGRGFSVTVTMVGLTLFAIGGEAS